MDILPHFGVSSELSEEEFVRRLVRGSTQDQVRDLRLALFLEAVEGDLADGGDKLVMRKKVGGGKTVKDKHAVDVWVLVGAIRRCERIPRTLLRNGKRAKEEWQKSQEKVRDQESVLNDAGSKRLSCSSMTGMGGAGAVGGAGAEDGAGVVRGAGAVDGAGAGVVGGAGAVGGTGVAVGAGAAVGTGAVVGTGEVVGTGAVDGTADGAVGGSEDVDSLVFRSRMVESVNALRDDLAALRLELRSQRDVGRDACGQLKSASPVKFCSLYVRVVKRLGHSSFGKTQLEELLQCQVVQYLCIKHHPSPVFRVKILENDLHGALDTGRKSGCFVDLWRDVRGGMLI